MSDLFSTPSTRLNFTTAFAGHVNDLQTAVAAAFNKFPTLSGNGSKGLVINSGGTAVEAVAIVAAAGGRFTGTINYRGADNASDTNSGYGSNALTANAGGTLNSAFGYRALRLCTTGSANTAVGQSALLNVTTGGNNTAVGSDAAGGGTGDDNTAVGYSALLAVANGNNNTAVGSNAAAAFSGDGITAVGYQAAKLVTGTQVTAIGYNALSSATTAGANTAIGYNAMASCVDGGFNTAIGQSALFGVTSGTLNTGAGQGALVDVAGGGSNTAVGAGSGINITSGNQNTYLGYHAYPSGNYSNSMGLGYNARPTASNQVVIGDANVTETVLRGQVKGGAGTGTGQPVMVGTLSVNSTPVGNVGAGTDDLMTYPLPADSLSANNKGIRVAAWGTTAANANAKTLTFAFGATTVLSKSIALGDVAIQWRVEATILRASSGAQVISALVYYGESPNSCTPFLFSASTTENEAVAITIKCTGAATADNDIVQRGMIVEFIN